MPAVQPSLPGLEPIAPRDKVFFAVRPDPAAFSRIEQIRGELCHEYGLKGARISSRCLHVSLLGVCECHDLPDDLIGATCEAAGSVVLPPFDVVFDRVMSFRNRQSKKPVVLLTSGGDTALAGLRNSLCDAINAAGLARCIPFRAAYDAAVRPADGGRRGHRTGSADRVRFRPCAQPVRPKPAH